MAEGLPRTSIDIRAATALISLTCVPPALDASAFWGYRGDNNEGRVEHFRPAKPDAAACRPGRAVPCCGLCARWLRRRWGGDLRCVCDGRRWRRPDDCLRVDRRPAARRVRP